MYAGLVSMLDCRIQLHLVKYVSDLIIADTYQIRIYTYVYIYTYFWPNLLSRHAYA